MVEAGLAWVPWGSGWPGCRSFLRRNHRFYERPHAQVAGDLYLIVSLKQGSAKLTKMRKLNPGRITTRDPLLRRYFGKCELDSHRFAYKQLSKGIAN